MRIIRSSEYHRMPWKNGGGETLEVAVSPAGASLEAFDWRVSMAHVASSGPFSRFPGVDRTLAVLSGAGIRLGVAGRGTMTLDRDTPPFAFPGDDPAAAELIDGPIDDLNVMTRRTSYRHRLVRIRAQRSAPLRRAADLLLVLIWEAAAIVRIADAAHALAAGDAILLDLEDEPLLEVVPAAPAQLFVIELWRA